LLKISGVIFVYAAFCFKQVGLSSSCYTKIKMNRQ
jgi:hypothetical protein